MDSFNNALTSLQRELLEMLKEGPLFYFSGGAALSGCYLGHRRSLDIDLFVNEASEVEAIAAHLRQVTAEQGWTIEEIRRYPGFSRYQIRNGPDSTLVDLVHETAVQVVPLSDKPECEGVRVDSIGDLVANKLCTLLGRSEVKDLVDLYFLAETGIDVLAHLPAALLKDGGMDPATLAFVIQQMPTDPAGLLLLRPLEAATLSEFRDRLVTQLVEFSWPRGDVP